jgi:hypothetical protein
MLDQRVGECCCPQPHSETDHYWRRQKPIDLWP